MTLRAAPCLLFWCLLLGLLEGRNGTSTPTEAFEEISSCDAKSRHRGERPDLVLFQVGTVHGRAEAKGAQLESKDTSSTSGQETQQAKLGAKTPATPLVAEHGVAAAHTEGPHVTGHQKEPVLSLVSAAEHTRHTAAQGTGGMSEQSLTTALGIADIVSLCVLVLVLLLALYFFWGGSWYNLQKDPLRALRGTAEQAGKEAKDKFEQERAAYAYSQAQGLSQGAMGSMYATQSVSDPHQSRRQQPVCC